MEGGFRIEGLHELEKALLQMPKATARGVVRRVAREALEPVARAARAKVPVDEGDLKESIEVSERLNASQRRKSGKHSDFEMHVGPSGLVQGITQEFGTFSQPAQPFLRPAWDAEALPTLDRFGTGMGIEIEKTAARLGAKTARLKAKG